MTLKEAAATVFTFGKYQGQSVAEVYIDDEKYLEWCQENIMKAKPTEKVLTAVDIFLSRGRS